MALQCLRRFRDYWPGGTSLFYHLTLGMYLPGGLSGSGGGPSVHTYLGAEGGCRRSHLTLSRLCRV